MRPAAVRVLDAAVAIKGPLTRDAMAGTIRQQRLIDTFARLMEGAPEVTCCAFATALIENL